jgi:putative transposase
MFRQTSASLTGLLPACCTLVMRTSRVVGAAIVLKPSTLLRPPLRAVHPIISSAVLIPGAEEAGPEGPQSGSHPGRGQHETEEPDMRLSANHATKITLAFGIPMNKDVVRRILAVRYHPKPQSGPSWLTVLGHAKDRLWSVDLFRCESRSSFVLTGCSW